MAEEETKAILNKELPEGFKMTELGPLPEGWKVVQLGQVIEKPQYGYTASANIEKIGPKLLRITDIQDGHVNWDAVPYCRCADDDIPKYLLKDGDILFARTGSVGKAFLVSSVPEASIFASYLIRVRVDRTRLDPYFAFLFMQTSAYWSQIASHTHGAVQPNVNATQLRSLILPLPPLSEQRAIAHVLRTVQRAKEATEQVIAALKEFKKSLMRYLFTYGPVPIEQADKVELKDTEIGPVPAHWEVVRLGDVADVCPSKIKRVARDILPFIPMSLISEGGGEISKYELRAASDVKSGILVSEGDLLLAKITPCLENGKQGIVKNILGGWGYATTEVFPIRAKNRLEIEFLSYFLLQPYVREALASKMEGTTGRQRLPRAVIISVPIPFPPLDEQKKIAEILISLDNKIKAEENKKSALETLFKTLLHNLMTGKIRVSNVE